jgi:hypothetical protein
MVSHFYCYRLDWEFGPHTKLLDPVESNSSTEFNFSLESAV